MNTIHALTLRTAAALGRLSELQRRAERLTTPNPVVRTTIKELTAALEELQVANEQLRSYNEELLATREHAAQAQARLEELVNLMPQVCIWTDENGIIREANEAAAGLLNVARHRLPGKPLSLFFTERHRFFEALGALSDGGAADLDTIVRPRERRPQPVHVAARRPDQDHRWCWFLTIYSEDGERTERSDVEVEEESGTLSSEA